jgi:hypothetical protein
MPQKGQVTFSNALDLPRWPSVGAVMGSFFLPAGEQKHGRRAKTTRLSAALQSGENAHRLRGKVGVFMVAGGHSTQPYNT